MKKQRYDGRRALVAPPQGLGDRDAQPEARPAYDAEIEAVWYGARGSGVPVPRDHCAVGSTIRILLHRPDHLSQWWASARGPRAAKTQLLRPVANGFNVVTVWSKDERAVVVRVVVPPNTRRPVVLPAGGKCCLVEGGDLGPCVRSECNVKMGRDLLRFREPEGRLSVPSHTNAEWTFHRHGDSQRMKRP